MTFKCSDCKSTFEKITTNQNLMRPKCPYCKEESKATKLHRVGDGAVSDEELQREKLLKEFMKTPEFQQSLLSKLMSPISQSSQNTNKAVDATADIVMQDYKMGDLPDKKMHVGETMAPRLDPVRQNMADNMFGGKKKGPQACLDMGTGRARAISGSNLNLGGIVKKAMAGGYRDGAVDPIAAVQSNRQKMPISYVNKGN